MDHTAQPPIPDHAHPSAADGARTARRRAHRSVGRAVAGAALVITVSAGSVAALPGSVAAGPSAVSARTTTDRAVLDGQTATLATQVLGLLPEATPRTLRAVTDQMAFTVARDELATLVATRLGVDPARMIAAWDAADRPHQIALFTALTQVGTPYRRNSAQPGVGFDCSGITSYAWAAAGVTLPRQSTQQIRVAAPRDPSTAQAGDLIQYPGHVMMWLGVDNTIVHARQRGRWVELDVVKRSRLRFGDPTGAPA